VQVVEVDEIEPQTAEAGLDRVAGLDRRRIGAAGPMGELAGDHQAVAAIGDGLAEQGLVVTRAVAGGGVEEGDAEVDRAVEGADRLGVVGRTVGAGKPHGPEALAADGEGGELGHGIPT
jgi:hypothetical protein